MELTGFSRIELQEVQKRYSLFDKPEKKDETSGVSAQDIFKLPELSAIKLARLASEKYTGRSQIFYPRELVLYMAELSSHKTPQEKVKFLFSVLDIKKFGFLSYAEIYRFYHALLHPALSDKAIQELTHNLIQETGPEINLEKFEQVFPAWEIAEKFTADLQMTPN